MAYNLVPSEVWRIIVDSNFGNRNAHVGFDYRIVSTTGPATTDVDLATYGDGLYGPLFKGIMTSIASYVRVRTFRLAPVVGRPVFQTVDTNAGIGTAGTNALPGQVAGLVSFYTALAGRTYRGRKYFPFPDVADDLGGRPTVSYYATRLAAIADAYKTPATVSGSGGGFANIQAVVFHRKLFTSTDIIARTARSNWATARRRGAFKPPRRRKH